MNIYIIGSLRNPRVPEVANELRKHGFAVFDDWYGTGPNADEHWQEYEQARGRSYIEALYGDAADNIYEFDKEHLDCADAAVLVAPAGKSGHLELGYMIGKGRLGYILLEAEPERWDVMYNFATLVVRSVKELLTQDEMQP